MIHDRNIHKSAGISLSKIQGLGARGPHTGDVRYVTKAGSTAVLTWINERVKEEFIHPTLDGAINACTANRGDVIYVLPEHTENIAADSGVDADVAGISIIGLGNGESRPIFSFITATTADFKIAAADILVENLVFKCNIANQAMMIEVTGDDAEISHCEFRKGSATGLNHITIATANAEGDRTHVHHCKFYSPSANGDSAIAFGGDTTGSIIEHNDIYGDYDLAGIDIPTAGDAQVNCEIRDNEIVNLASGQHGIQVVNTTSTGRIVRNIVVTDSAITVIDAGGMEMFDNKWNDFTDQGPAEAYPASDSQSSRDNGRGGTYWYLDSGATAGGLGTSWDAAYDTLAEAVAAASTYDTILVKDGSVYDLGAAQNITTNGLHIIGTGEKDQNFIKAMFYGGTGHFITINAHEVLIDNIGFNGPLNNYDAIHIGTTMEPFKVKIKNCKFDLSAGEIGIRIGKTGGAGDAPDCVIENNLFRSFSTTGIYACGTRAQIRNNTFLIDAGKTGIDVVQHDGSRPDLIIQDNVMHGSNSTDTGIKFTNTPAEDKLVMTGNKVTNCATPVTESKYTSWYDGNYWGVNDSRYHAQADNGEYPGRVFYADSDQAAAGDGRCWASAFTTLTAAVAAATTAKDTILVASSNTCYTEAAVLNLTTNGLQIIGMGNKEPNHAKAMMLAPTAAGHIMTINGHETLIDNICFNGPANNYDAIQVGTAAEPFKVKIVNCKFDLGTYGEIAILAGGLAGGTDAPDIVIENNLFRSCNTSCVYASATRGKIHNNIFLLKAGTRGIDVVQHSGGGRPDLVITDNLIKGANSTDTGVYFTNTIAEANLLMTGNKVRNCAAAITTGLYASWYEGNDWGARGVLVPGKSYSLKSASVSLIAGDVGLWTIAGGPIKITQLGLQIVTATDAASKVGFTCTPTNGAETAVTAEAGSGLEINAQPTGELCWSALDAGALDTYDIDGGTIPVTPAGASQVIPPGTFQITMENTNPTTGAADVYIEFSPLGPGVTVIPA
jgi:hypothetical protein